MASASAKRQPLSKFQANFVNTIKNPREMKIFKQDETITKALKILTEAIQVNDDARAQGALDTLVQARLELGLRNHETLSDSLAVLSREQSELGQHEKMVNGFARRASTVPRTARSISIITSRPAIENAPVTIALLVVLSSAYRRTLSPIAFGTSLGTTAVDE